MEVLKNIKLLLEIDFEETMFDSQILSLINSGIRYLMNNKIPLCFVDENTDISEFNEAGLNLGDEEIVISFLNFYTMQRFDRNLMSGSSYSNTTLNWIDKELNNLIYQLKQFMTMADLYEINKKNNNACL